MEEPISLFLPSFLRVSTAKRFEIKRKKRGRGGGGGEWGGEVKSKKKEKEPKRPRNSFVMKTSASISQLFNESFHHIPTIMDSNKNQPVDRNKTQ